MQAAADEVDITLITWFRTLSIRERLRSSTNMLRTLKRFTRVESMRIRYSGGTLHHATVGSAGYDLFSSRAVDIHQGGLSVPVPTGIRLEIPNGYVGFICSRSGLVLKHGVEVANAPGVIDSDYRGEVVVLLRNMSHVTHRVSVGDRIAQIVFIRVETPQFERIDISDLSHTARGQSGFGSTG